MSPPSPERRGFTLSGDVPYSEYAVPVMPDDPDVIRLSEEQVTSVRIELLAAAIEDLRTAIREAQADPSEQHWYRVVDTMTTLIGPNETYALLTLASERRS